jgi:hypothetical protein
MPVQTFQHLRAIIMTLNERTRAAIPNQDRRNLSCLAWFSSPRGKTKTSKNVGRRQEYGESVMELRVQLKVCEGCGCLWYRPQNQVSVYCRECEVKLQDFPTPESRKRRGRPGRKPLTTMWAMVEATGGTQ